MTTVTLRFDAKTEQALRERAARSGQSLESYLERLINDNVRVEDTTPGGAAISDEEFDRLLDDLAAGVSVPHLQNDLSRADIYTDHD
jgi:hypothetical protein